MAKTIDLTSAVINITPTKAVNWGGGTANKGVGQDFSVSSADGYFKKNGKAFNSALVSINNIDTNMKAIKVAIANGRKFEIDNRKADLRRQREERIERAKNLGKNALQGLGKATGAAVGKAKGLLGALGILGTVANIAGGFLAFGVLKKLQNSNFLGSIIKGFMGAVKGIMDAVAAIPTSTLDKIGKFAGKFIKFIGNIVGWGIKNISQGLDKILDNNGNLKMSIGGIFQLFTGIAGLGLTYRYLKNPTKIITDFTDTIGGIAGLFGIRIPGLSGGRGGRGWQKLGTKQNPMHVWVVNQGGGLGDMLNRRTPGLGIKPRFATPRGSGINFSKNFVSRGANGGNIARMGSLINESTGSATRMLGGNKAVDVMKNLKANNVSKANRARVLAGELSQTQAIKIAQEGGPQGVKGLLSKGGNLGRGLWSRVKGIGSWGKGLLKGGWKNLQAFGTTLSNLNPMQLFENLKGSIGGKIDDLLTNNQILKSVKNLKNMKPKDVGKAIKGLVTKAGKSAKPALKSIKSARKAFPVPGLDALIGALTAVGEIALFKASPGNAIFGALGGVLGSAAGMAAGSAALPGPGTFIGSMAGGIAGELLGRKLARMTGNALDPKIRDADVFGTGAPLFATEGNGYGKQPAEGMQRGGQVFGGTPNGDSVPAYLERGEYVVNRNAVAAIGPRNLNALNYGIPRFQEGGMLAKFGGSTQKRGYIGTDHKANRFPGPGGTESFLQVDKKTGDIEIWQEKWGSDKYVGTLKKGTSTIEYNKAMWGGANKRDKAFYNDKGQQKIIQEKAIQLVKNANKSKHLPTAEANELLKKLPGGMQHMIFDQTNDMNSAINSEGGVMTKAKIEALTNMVMDTGAAMSGNIEAAQRLQASQNSVDVGGDANGTQDSSLSASSVTHTSTNEALSALQSMELNNIR